MNYRHDIDGLRAVAVILVVFFHLELQNVPGGFIGVDVFFVISGYLITNILCREIGDGSFTFKAFYLRRLRRLGPALLSTIILTLGIGWFVFPPEIYADTARSAIAVIFALGNIFFWSETSYFGSDALFQPLLHTWSLGVEEQFYFVWPALLWLCIARFSKAKLLIGVFTLLIVSLVSSELLLERASAAAFYLTPFRMFEFGIGAVLAISNWQARNAIVANVVALTGLLWLYQVALTYNDLTPFPGLNALFPALATGLIIYAGADPIINRVLALAPMRYIGKISYSVYLLHWPIIIFYHFLVGRPETSGEILTITGLSLSAGALQYHLVEAPARRRVAGQFWFSSKALVVTVSAVAVVTLASSWRIQNQSGFPQRLSPEVLALFEDLDQAIQNRNVLAREGQCNGSSIFSIDDYVNAFDSCLPDVQTGFIVVLGDSHAKDIYVGLQSTFPDAPIVQMTANGCALNAAVANDPFCRPYFEFWKEWLVTNADSMAAIIYSQNGEWLLSRNVVGKKEPQMDRIAQVFSGIAQYQLKDKPFIFWGPRAHFDPSIEIAIARSASVENLGTYYNGSDYAPEIALDTILARRSSEELIHYVSSVAPLCQPDCPVLTKDNRLFVVDRAHWSPGGADEAVRLVLQSDPILRDLFDN